MRSTGLPLDGLGAPWMMPQDEQALLAYSSDGDSRMRSTGLTLD